MVWIFISKNCGLYLSAHIEYTCVRYSMHWLLACGINMKEWGKTVFIEKGPRAILKQRE